jgi:hypothetical protein
VKHAARTRRRRRGQAGISLIEALVTAFIGTLVLTGTVTCMVGVASSADRAQTYGVLQARSQKASDELLYELRGASQVLASRTINGVTYTTGASSVVFSAPGLSISSGTPDILTSVTDYFAFAYSPDTKILYQSISPGTGSVRPTRTAMALAKKVNSVAFTYQVREQFTASTAGTFSKVLTYTATGTPMAYVDGQNRTCTYTSGTNTASVSSVTLGQDVEFVYPVSPTNTAALAKVSRIDATITTSDVSGANKTRTVTLSGTARLRNVRN